MNPYFDDSSDLRFKHSTEERVLRSDLFYRFPFHTVDLLVPGSKKPETDYRQLLTSVDNGVYFMVKDVSAKAFIEWDFVNSFAREGELWATTHVASPGNHNFLAITPSGKLILSLRQYTAEILNRVAIPSLRERKRRRPNRTLEFNILDENYRPGKKLFETTRLQIYKVDHILFTVILKWKPKRDVCPFSIKNYFVSQGKECIACEPVFMDKTRYKVFVPPIKFETFDDEKKSDLLEWTGAQMYGLKYSKFNFVSEFTPPTGSKVYDNVFVDSFKGFFVGYQAEHVFKNIRTIFEKDSSIPYIVLNISGYYDCFIDSKNFKGFTSEEKIICIIVFRCGRCVLVTWCTRER